MMASVIYLAMLSANVDHTCSNHQLACLTETQLQLASGLWHELNANAERLQEELLDPQRSENLFEDSDDASELEDFEEDFEASSPPVTRAGYMGPPSVPLLSKARLQELASSLLLQNTNSIIHNPAALIIMFQSKSSTGAIRNPSQICNFLGKLQYVILVTIFNEAQEKIQAEQHPAQYIQGHFAATENSLLAWVEQSISKATLAVANITNLPKVMLVPGSFADLSYKGAIWELSPFRKYVASLPQACGILINDLFGGVDWQSLVDQVSAGEKGHLVDDLDQASSGYSWFDDERNNLSKLWDDTFIQLCKAHDLCEDTLDVSTGSYRRSWKFRQVQRFLEISNELLERLQVCCYEGLIAPPYGSIFIATLLRNSPEGLQRDLYIVNGIMSFIFQPPHNASSQKVIIQSLPWCIHKLLAFFISIVRPAVIFLVKTVLQLKDDVIERLEQYLWVQHDGQFISTDVLTTNMKHEIGQSINLELASLYGVRANHHLKLEWARQFVKYQPNTQDLESINALFDAQYGHTRKIGEAFYARIKGNGFRHSLSSTLIKEYQEICAYIQGCFGFESIVKLIDKEVHSSLSE